MNRKRIIAIIVAIAISVGALVAFMYHSGMFNASKESTKTADGAEIEISEEASGFACSCGCSSGNEMEDCKCEKCKETKEETQKETETAEKEVVCYLDSENGEMVEIDLSGISLEPMTKDKVDAQEEVIKTTGSLCVRRCESVVYDNGVDDPQFTAESESRYFYDATCNRVLNARGIDITGNLNFSVSKCENSLDFLKAYLKSNGMPTDFVTEDVSHVRDLYLNQRVYSFGINECEEISYLENKMEGLNITERDCTYQVKVGEDGTDRIVYVTVTVAGIDEDGATTVRYITYVIDYNPVISE